MLRKLTIVLLLAMSLLVTQRASAIPVNLDTYALGSQIAGPLTDPFDVAEAPPDTMGEAVNTVYFDGTLYTYVHEVRPTLNDNFALNTQFDVAGYTGTGGWSFGDAAGAGGSGTLMDFLFFDTAPLSWVSLIGLFDFPSTLGWDAGEPIRFFFVSTRPPTLGFYNLIGKESGTALSYAPAAVPEPGSIALLGSGLVGLYTALRRRRRLSA
jgi:PEP-CTERM motif